MLHAIRMTLAPLGKFLKFWQAKLVFLFIYSYCFSTLNFNKHPLLIGGLASADPVLERPGQIHSDDLVGCVHSVLIDGRPLSLTDPLESRGISSTCKRVSNGGPCSQRLSEDTSLSLCGAFDDCMDRWHSAMCRCGGNLLSPDCYNSLEPISLGDGGFVEFKISEKHRRMQLLDNLYAGSTVWTYDNERMKRLSNDVNETKTAVDPPKILSVLFRTVHSEGLILYAATNNHFTSIEVREGKLFYQSKQRTSVNMTVRPNVDDGKWHNVTLSAFNRVLHIIVDDVHVGDELDSTSVHDFLDPYLTVMSVGGVRRDLFIQDSFPVSFDGCLANFTINNEIQPFNGSGSIFQNILTRGKVYQGCHSAVGVGAAQIPDPLSIGITLVIVFFVILLIAILVSFVVFRLRKQQKEKSGEPGSVHKQGGGSTLLGTGVASNDILGRGIHSNDASIGFHADGDVIRGLVGPELLSKKYKERDLGATELQRPQRPDIIEREVVSKSPPLREDHHQSSVSGVDLNEYPEHYDLENASSIAPSDIDIVYHYKGYREGGGIRKYKATPPPVASYTHHKHGNTSQQQHRHSPHHSGSFAPRAPPQTSQNQPSNTPRQHQSTPLARLSPSSELSSQQPRILTLHDISGKPLQSALLAATTSSSGGVGKDVLHSNSERSLNSPVMSQLSGQSSSASRTKPGVPTQMQTSNVNSVVHSVGLTAEEIQRLNARTSSLVSTLDAVSSIGEAPRTSHLNHLHHSPPVDAHSSSSTTDESGNDSFTCSEIEYDNNSISGDKFPKSGADDDDDEDDDDEDRRRNDNGTSAKPPQMHPPYDGFDCGSLSTLVASDDELSSHMGHQIYRPSTVTSPPTTALGWDYLLNWGPNFDNLIGVFKDIAELPDGGGMVPLRMSSNVQKPSEEYV